ncbi:glycosyltransferase family 2 protein [Cupriavidus taiwanensis]|uniref:Bactoprenol glucosyl transferase CPS-53 (KpLE1) prophage n=1 Tax=Cupriavidus taiwanensis TaxID=164546 RepID=A0A375GUX0_9BURK|nr:glycosyltransferase family 2 protein [Cupriavidus taiwanensis]SOY56151.1 prophage-derived bactoprenol glucosyl transferase [Cupriavidus taiwanensis]SOY56697.1 prophage-derived bactoprenol glucosyl transferase [Cupriavidus taiwanensis]SOY90628.1 prophage-derived bactoprenol glucosyl transferase [Cupriavidus taiwanensis]SOZ25120.1 prophage-derived bactoprenol glucosyl transferase [Cupriavidus taiwanensis]SOZ63210.1 prophage-derived bactoprenol glucosyl transferase [Cupriavidus taiwanensis]
MSGLNDVRLLTLVVPCYNESDSIGKFFHCVIPVLEAIDAIRFEIVLVNDGSSDDTLAQLIAWSHRDPRVRVVDLTRNFGKEAALTAGLDEALGDAVIPIDADLQDPPALIPELVRRWREGAEVVLAQRSSRACDSWLKRMTAGAYYRVHNKLSDQKLPVNVGDFRLMDRVVINALKQMPERRRFMKGLFAWVGYRTVIVPYEREARSAGHSKFSGWRLWNFALEGITSFSTMPLRSWTYIGVAIALGAFGYGAFIVARTLVLGIDVPGYASLLSALLFLGGIQLIGLGVVGEYVGRIYDEAKGRPIYLVRRRYQETGQSRSVASGRRVIRIDRGQVSNGR